MCRIKQHPGWIRHRKIRSQGRKIKSQGHSARARGVAQEPRGSARAGGVSLRVIGTLPLTLARLLLVYWYASARCIGQNYHRGGAARNWNGVTVLTRFCTSPARSCTEFSRMVRVRSNGSTKAAPVARRGS